MNVSIDNSPQSFVHKILEADPHAKIIVAGDFNDNPTSASVFGPLQGDLLYRMADLAELAPAERYTFVWKMSAVELDHMFVSDSLRKALPPNGPAYQIVHISTWNEKAYSRLSDHDPIEALFTFCRPGTDDVEHGDANLVASTDAANAQLTAEQAIRPPPPALLAADREAERARRMKQGLSPWAL